MNWGQVMVSERDGEVEMFRIEDDGIIIFLRPFSGVSVQMYVRKQRVYEREDHCRGHYHHDSTPPPGVPSY